AHGGCPHASIELAAIPEMSREEGDVGRPRARERCRPGSPIDCRPIDDLVRAQLRKTEWNTGAREKDLAHLGGLDGYDGGEISRRRCAARCLDLLRQRQRAVEPPVSLSDVNRHGTQVRSTTNTAPAFFLFI